jgi:uncharacterized protein HemX
MTTRLLIAYLLIVLLGSGIAGVIWWTIHNSQRQKSRRYYREKRQRTKG